MEGIVRTHLEKYLPDLHCSPTSSLRESLSSPARIMQLLTVHQITDTGSQSHGFVLGLLTSNDCGELTLEDKTGKVNCEVRKAVDVFNLSVVCHP